MPKPYILGISGGSASGKTFLLRQLMSTFPEEGVTLISQDNYYKKREAQRKEADGLINFDHPDAIRLDLLTQDVKRLIGGESIELQEYTFNNPNKVPQTIVMKPAPLMIVEGLFVLHHEPLAQIQHLKVFVDAQEHIKIGRRLKRDITERGYSMESILRDYERFVAPMYEQFVAPSKQIADLIIPNNKHMYKAVQVLVNHLRSVVEP
ncbi:MAG: uridine kinase [Bacteroidota bacterium]